MAFISRRSRSLEPTNLSSTILPMPTTGTVKRSRIGASTTSSGRTTTAASSPLRSASRPAVDLEVRLAELHVAVPVGPEQEIRAAEERRDEPRAGPLIQRARLADFLEPPAVHDADAVRHAERFVLVVRHEHRRDADGALNLADRAPQLLADLRVERAERLVEQQHARLVRQRARERDALLLAARELARQPLVVALERDEPEQLGAPAAPVRAPHAARAQRELDVVGHRHVAEQRVVLEHEADLALAGADVRHVAPVQHDAAVVDRRQARDRAQQRALAAAGRAEQHEQLAVLDLRRDVADGRGAAKFLGYLLESDRHGLAASGIRRVVSECYRRVGDKVGIKAVTQR